MTAAKSCPMDLWCCADELTENSKFEVKSRGRLSLLLLISLGFRIAPEEVEALIVDASPSVTAASVHSSEDGLSLVAFVVCNGPASSFNLEALKGTMPGYMLPSTVHIVERLPTNSNDKVDHKIVALNRRELMQSAQKESNGVTPPHKNASMKPYSADVAGGSKLDSEEVISHLGKIWQDTLGLAEIP